jgi:hypothetical protein
VIRDSAGNLWAGRMGRILKRVWSATVRATCTELPRFAWLEVLQERVEVDALVSQFELQEHFSRQQNEMGRWGRWEDFRLKWSPVVRLRIRGVAEIRT